MENILNIVYREPELEDAEKIVDFYPNLPKKLYTD